MEKMTTEKRNEANAALYQKLSAEQEQYKSDLLALPPEEILEHAYEYSVRKDILSFFEKNDIPEWQAQILEKKKGNLLEVFEGLWEWYIGEAGLMELWQEIRELAEEEANMEKNYAEEY